MVSGIKSISRLVILVSAILLILLPACGPAQGQTAPPSSGNTTKPQGREGVNLAPMPQPDKGNEKLDTALNQLISAEKQGQAEAFARQRNIRLVDGKVRVHIEAKPGQLDKAANVTAKFGTIEIVSPRSNSVQALVPIASLTALAADDSIRVITIPVSVIPAN